MCCIKEEIRKLSYNKVLIAFLTICLLFNAGVILASSNTSSELKTILQDYQPQSGKEIFKDIDGSGLGSMYYDERYIDSHILVALMHEKYQKLELPIEQLAKEQADLSTYAGELTPYVHRALFEYLTKAIMIEGILLFTFLVLETFFMEQHNKTLYTVYSSLRGRRIVFDKMFSVLLIGMLGMVILSCLSYFAFFQIWDFEKIWDANVASSFNYITDSDEPFLWKPFITWTSFTVKQYFCATLVLMVGIWLAWWLLSMMTVLVNKRISVAIGILAGGLIIPFFGLILFRQLPELPELYCLNTFSITVNVYYSHMWFTDQGYHTILPWQETLSVILHLVLGLIGVFVGYHVFRRKDVC